MADDWDLQAVVRGCTTANSAANCSSSTATTTAFINSTTPAFSAAAASCGVNNLSFVPQQTGDFFSIRDVYFRNGGKEELPELHRPLLIQASPPSISPLSIIGGLKNSSQQMQHLNDQQALISKQNLSMSRTCRTKASIISSNSHNSRSKRRKKVMKRVVEIAAEALSSDTWSWRKYGQKPIKGSPYPRGYYKCSTSKGCLARKQVERKRTDPGIFIVTYTADHNHPMPLPTHRNLLAGRSSRIKPATSGEPSSSNPCSSLLVSHSVNGSPTSPELEKIEIEGNYNEDTVDEEEDMDINMDAPTEMKLEEEFFEGLGELEAVSGVSNTFSQNVQQVQVPCLTEDIISTADQGEFDF